MGEQSYQIIVTGELLDGAYLPEVKARLAALFKTPADKLDPLFSGKRVVVKKGLAADAAQKYVAAIQAAGLRCSAEALGGEPAPKPAAAPVAETPPPAGPLAGVSIAPAGAILVETPKVAPPQIDTAAFSMAPAGATLVEHVPPPAPVIDTSALSVAPLGSRLVEAVKLEPPAVSIGGLVMAPPGSDMGEAKRAAAPPPPKTDHLELE